MFFSSSRTSSITRRLRSSPLKSMRRRISAFAIGGTQTYDPPCPSPKFHPVLKGLNSVRANVFPRRPESFLAIRTEFLYVREIGIGVYSFAYGHLVRIDRDQNI